MEDQIQIEGLYFVELEDEHIIVKAELFRIKVGEEFMVADQEDVENYYKVLEVYPPVIPDSLIIQKFQNGIFPEHLKVIFGFNISFFQRRKSPLVITR